MNGEFFTYVRLFSIYKTYIFATMCASCITQSSCFCRDNVASHCQRQKKICVYGNMAKRVLVLRNNKQLYCIYLSVFLSAFAYCTIEIVLILFLFLQ